MLVLTRKHDEQIVIGENGNEIVITVLKIQGSEKVSIGIEAHPSTPIFRRELLTRGNDNRTRRKDKNGKASSDDVKRLVEVAQLAQDNEQHERQDKQEEQEEQEFSCYLP